MKGMDAVKKKIHMSKFIVIFVVLSLFSFTALAMYVQLKSGVELSATLIGCFFGFCTRRTLDVVKY